VANTVVKYNLCIVLYQVKSFETAYTVGDLTEGKEYLFGVAAENEMGVGKVKETEMFIKAAKPLGNVLS
jgi:hypothetical protein